MGCAERTTLRAALSPRAALIAYGKRITETLVRVLSADWRKINERSQWAPRLVYPESVEEYYMSCNTSFTRG